MGQITSVDLPTPRMVLAVGAHADDVEFGCGATLAKWAGAGCRLHHVICTDGAKGTWDPHEDIAALIATREDEQRRASVVLGGAGEVTFLRYPDGKLVNGEAERRRLVEVIRRVQPGVILGHDPWKRWRLHPDHRHAGFLLTDAIVAARDPHYFPDTGPVPHRPSALLLFEADEPDHAEDAAGYEQTKLDALLAHRSQWRSTLGIDGPADRPGHAAFEARVHTNLSEAGGRCGRAMAEEFKLVGDL